MSQIKHELILIAAVDEDWGIAQAGKIPWHNPEDLQFFRQKTYGHALITGRKTYETLNNGKLTGRHLGVCSSAPVDGARALSDFVSFSSDFPLKLTTKDDIGLSSSDTSAFYAPNLDALLVWAKSSEQDVYVIGGRQIFESCLNICDRIILSHIQGIWDCDLFFPTLPQNFYLAKTLPHDTFIERHYCPKHATDTEGVGS